MKIKGGRVYKNLSFAPTAETEKSACGRPRGERMIEAGIIIRGENEAIQEFFRRVEARSDILIVSRAGGGGPLKLIEKVGSVRWESREGNEGGDGTARARRTQGGR